MSNIIPFHYGSRKIRVIKDEQGNPLFIAKEVCEALHLSDVSKTVEKLDDDEKLTRKLFVSGQHREVWLVNEAGLYTLIVRSNKPEAKKFKRWITHQVLPSIRKTGKYEMQGVSEIDLIIKSAQALKKIEMKQIDQDKRIESLEAKSYQNSGHTGYWTISAWCKLNRLNLSLNEAMRKGRDAARISKEWSADIGKVSDERYGVVNSYREDVLSEVFESVEEAA